MAKKTTPPPWDELNHTELVQLAQRVGFVGVTRAVPREEVILALQTWNLPETKDPLEAMRDKYIDWINRRKDRVGMQMPRGFFCPQCHICPDAQFADCWIDNHHRID